MTIAIMRQNITRRVHNITKLPYHHSNCPNKPIEFVIIHIPLSLNLIYRLQFPTEQRFIVLRDLYTDA